MKIKIIITTIFLGIITIFPNTIFAANFTLSPTKLSYTVGDIITIPVSVNPNGVTIYTVSLNMNIPSDLLSIQSFTMNDAWMPLKQAGYDSIDNINGVLIKTGGYPGGFNSTTAFGRITLKAKKAGTASIVLNSTSNILDKDNLNKNSGSQTIILTINPLVKKVIVPPPTSTVPAETPVIATTTKEEIINEISDTESEVVNTTDNQLTAAVGDTDNGIKFWLYFAIAIALIIIVTAIIVWRRNRNKDQTLNQ